MKQIQKPNALFYKAIGTQKPTSDTNYRLLAYSLILHVNNGALLYNALSCELLFLEKDELDNKFNSDYLFQHWFIVPDAFDDRKFVDQFITIYRLLADQSSITNSYTVMTTTDCNARCFYCYEKGRPRVPMSMETADKLVDYIISNYKQDKSDNKKVSLHWFGGEPLYNNKVIYHVCRKLTQTGVEFHSRMTSNGYLFDDQLVADARELWHLKKVQISLDGTEKVYNRSKAYIHKGVNAYERVLDNIEKLLRNKIRVIVRMNVDMYNADDLMTLTDILYKRYGHCKGFTCYTHPLFEVAGDKPHERTEENREAVYKKLLMLNQYIETKGLHFHGSVAKELPVAHCMADNGRSVVVSSNGGVGLCEHFSESEFFSHLDSLDNIDYDMINSFNERCSPLDICNDCTYYPQCTRLKKCIEGSLCFPQIKQQRIDGLKKSMLITYERWLERKSDEDSNVSVNDEIDESTNQFC